MTLSLMVVPLCGMMVAPCAMVGNFVSDGRYFVPGLVRHKGGEW